MSGCLVLAFRPCWSFVTPKKKNPSTPVVNAGPLGDIRGVAGLTFINYKPHFEFLGIPICKSTNEQDRFWWDTSLSVLSCSFSTLKILSCSLASGTYKRATASRRWNIQRNVRQRRDGIQCVQPGLFPGTATGTEDCLILNVITQRWANNLTSFRF